MAAQRQQLHDPEHFSEESDEDSSVHTTESSINLDAPDKISVEELNELQAIGNPRWLGTPHRKLLTLQIVHDADPYNWQRHRDKRKAERARQGLAPAEGDQKVSARKLWQHCATRVVEELETLLLRARKSGKTADKKLYKLHGGLWRSDRGASPTGASLAQTFRNLLTAVLPAQQKRQKRQTGKRSKEGPDGKEPSDAEEMKQVEEQIEKLTVQIAAQYQYCRQYHSAKALNVRAEQLAKRARAQPIANAQRKASSSSSGRKRKRGRQMSQQQKNQLGNDYLAAVQLGASSSLADSVEPRRPSADSNANARASGGAAAASASAPAAAAGAGSLHDPVALGSAAGLTSSDSSSSGETSSDGAAKSSRRRRRRRHRQKRPRRDNDRDQFAMLAELIMNDRAQARQFYEVALGKADQLIVALSLNRGVLTQPPSQQFTQQQQHAQPMVTQPPSPAPSQ